MASFWLDVLLLVQVLFFSLFISQVFLSAFLIGRPIIRDSFFFFNNFGIISTRCFLCFCKAGAKNSVVFFLCWFMKMLNAGLK